MTKKLDEGYLKHQDFDPFIILGDKVLCIVYVDDLILWAKYENDIYNLAIQVRELVVNLEAAGFLGVTLKHYTDTGFL